MPRISGGPALPEQPAKLPAVTTAAPKQDKLVVPFQPPAVIMPADHTRVAPQGQARLIQSFVEAESAEPAAPVVDPAAAEAARAHEASIAKLEDLKPGELHKLGRKDPEAFFKALLPAALESERQFGAPAVMTLVQAAVESDFARSPIGGYNLFGIKGSGPAGSIKLNTREVIKGKTHYVKEPFAKFNNFYEAVKGHGKLYTKKPYAKAMEQFKKDSDVMKFIDNVAKIYATDPQYARTLKTRIKEYGLMGLVKEGRAELPPRAAE